MLSYLPTIHLYHYYHLYFHDRQTSANVLNKDLEMIQSWVFQWKMKFNADPTKQAQEAIFSRKTKNSLMLL